MSQLNNEHSVLERTDHSIYRACISQTVVKLFTFCFPFRFWVQDMSFFKNLLMFQLC